MQTVALASNGKGCDMVPRRQWLVSTQLRALYQDKNIAGLAIPARSGSGGE